MNKPFRILSLSGGGVRGIYQAIFLKKISQSLPKPLISNFDLICGTSTGAIVGLAIALEEDIDVIADLYLNKSKIIFKKRFLSGFRSGGIYDCKNLKTELEKVFKEKTLQDCNTNVLLTASSLTQSQYKVFDNFREQSSKTISVVDALLCSTAAPSYFPPAQITGEERAYVDGGLWANSPTGVGITYAKKYLNIHPSEMRVLSIGTCDFKNIQTYSSFKKNKRNSISTIKKIIDLFFSTQESYDHHYVEEHINSENYIRVSSYLDKYISLDDVSNSKNKLPSLAEEAAEKNINKIIKLLKNEDNHDKFVHYPKREDLIPDKLIYETGLSAFYPSREHYIYRESVETLETYANTAKETITFVSVSLVKGINYDELSSILKRKIEDPHHNFIVMISLLNPFKPFLMESLAAVFGEDKDTIKTQIIKTASKLIALRKSLQNRKRNNLVLKFHNAIPFGSAIIIDEKTSNAKIQIETKAYKLSNKKSFAFEIIPVKKDGFFFNLLEGYNCLINEGEQMGLTISKNK